MAEMVAMVMLMLECRGCVERGGGKRPRARTAGETDQIFLRLELAVSSCFFEIRGLALLFFLCLCVCARSKKGQQHEAFVCNGASVLIEDYRHS